MSLKKTVRVELRKRLKELTLDDIRSQSQEITRKVLEHPKYKAAKSVGVFISMEDEIQTKYIISDIFSQRKSCYIPRYESRSSQMSMVHIPTLKELMDLPRDNPYRIPQPAADSPFEDVLMSGDKSLDLILVPGLGFTKNGKRIGRGKGFYDRFLQKYWCSRVKPHTIGLAFSEVILDDIPVTENDYILDEIICPGV